MSQEMKDLIKYLVHTPRELSLKAKQRLQEIERDRAFALYLPIEEVGEYFAPMEPRQTCIVNGQTHNGKTMFLDYWIQKQSELLIALDSPRWVVKIDFENYAQDIALEHYDRYSPEPLDYNAMMRSREKIDWKRAIHNVNAIIDSRTLTIAADMRLAESIYSLNLTNVMHVLNRAVQPGGLFKKGIEISAVFVDYLQAFPIDEEHMREKKIDQRRLQVASDFERMFQMAGQLVCPVVVGTQARENLKGAHGSNMLIPGRWDIHESTDPARRTHRQIALWMPKTTHQVGEILEHEKGRQRIVFEVKENTMWVEVQKQRGPHLPSGRKWNCAWDYDNYTIAPDRDDEVDF